MRALAEDEEIERALRYLVRSVESTGDNPKPVILHSTRVGMDLYNREYQHHIVIAGLLHDLLEDTAVTSDAIRSTFGEAVANIVDATSCDEDIDEYLDRHYDMYHRCFELGRDAVVVKAADILDNSEYYGMADADELQTRLLKKLEYFLDHSDPYIGDEAIYQELTDTLPLVRERVRETT